MTSRNIRIDGRAEIRDEMNRPDYKFMHYQSQDIDMPRLVAEARARQPGLIVVDRDVPGPYQDYLTPEARVPGNHLARSRRLSPLRFCSPPAPLAGSST